MESLNAIAEQEDWQVLLTFLPEDWRVKARELGALRRCRKFADAELLLRALLIHLAEGCSLRETSVRLRHGNIAAVSDVALLKRLKVSGDWFQWMAFQLMQGWVDKQPSAIFGKDVRIRIIDGSTIQEPGSTGSTWRIHYSIRLPSLQCDEVHVTSPQVGESFKRFTVHPGDLFVGDRGFAHRGGIAHVSEGGGDVLVRINLSNVPLVNSDGSAFPLLERLRTLTGTKLGDWDVWVPYEHEVVVPGRVCAVKKSKEAGERARRKALRENSRKRRQVKAETIEAAGYIFVFTTLDRRFSPTTILEMYRGRWQIELVFKRLKSIIALGHLKKTDPDAARAWLHGKIFIAFLVEALVAAGERFFPWGYPLCPDVPKIPMPMEGDFFHASSSSVYDKS